MMSIHIIIGKNFGDEGKGLATDFFASQSQQQNKSCIVIRHNGGGQAGHTVDLHDKRFIFHQLSSGSFRNADTYWAKTFLPDLYKLNEEFNDFSTCHNKAPQILAHPMCRCVYIDDILINMALETHRGSDRHGSCGMGINEAVERSKYNEYCLYLGQIQSMTVSQLCEKLFTIRKKYVPERLSQLGLSFDGMGEYAELISDPQVIINVATEMKRAADMISVSDEAIVSNYDNVIFEGAQGLLLDEDNLQYAPHLTTSKTGVENPHTFIKEHLQDNDAELVYVTRSYVTRHGAGPLPHENERIINGINTNDKTNSPNPWQGALRFAPHGTEESFFKPMCDDMRNLNYTVSIMVTHLNETNGDIVFANKKTQPSAIFKNTYHTINKLYLSSTPFSNDIINLLDKTED